jgi:hypothetical protein
MSASYLLPFLKNTRTREFKNTVMLLIYFLRIKQRFAYNLAFACSGYLAVKAAAVAGVTGSSSDLFNFHQQAVSIAVVEKIFDFLDVARLFPFDPEFLP